MSLAELRADWERAMWERLQAAGSSDLDAQRRTRSAEAAAWVRYLDAMLADVERAEVSP